MVKVKLLSKTEGHPLDLASYAGLVCYQGEEPPLGKRIDVENRLFATGHHTTLQHFYCSFFIEGISVGDVTFGLHLASPFYNTCQRSGRFCAGMFSPDFGQIENYIQDFWPEVYGKKLEEAMLYIRRGVNLYHGYFDAAVEVAKRFIAEERPKATPKYIEINGPKIAQEQLRMFIPVIFPTGMIFTVNLTALAALYEAAWTPAMKQVTAEMAKLVLAEFPEVKFLFNEEKRFSGEWAITPPNSRGIRRKPKLRLLEISGEENFLLPEKGMMEPLDKLFFTWLTMGTGFIRTQVEISTVTMGQDQRHRTIRRGAPDFTGNFYLPPIMDELRLEHKALEMMRQWSEISKKVPKTLAMILAPYGAMVAYEKLAPFSAVIHEQRKRLCWCAQEEIYHLSRQLRQEIEEVKGSFCPLLQIFEPPCFQSGECAERARYCGRDRSLRERGDRYCPERRV